MLRSGSSYLAQSELVLTFGLGQQRKPTESRSNGPAARSTSSQTSMPDRRSPCRKGRELSPTGLMVRLRASRAGRSRLLPINNSEQIPRSAVLAETESALLSIRSQCKLLTLVRFRSLQRSVVKSSNEMNLEFPPPSSPRCSPPWDFSLPSQSQIPLKPRA